MSDRKINLEVAVDPNGVETGVNRAKRSLADLGACAKKSGTDASAGVDKINDSLGKVGSSGDAAAQKVDRSTRSMINSIQRATAEIESLGKGASVKFEALANIRGVDRAYLDPYIKNLKAAEDAQKAFAMSSANVGLSAGQMQAALRGVPAQLTDIVTSLQGGQQPLTVFLQQGGQLRDMFGGAAPAAKALGGAVLGLVNPFTVGAAAAVALGAAYNAGSKEADEFNKTLVLTGNAVGSSVNQLSAMAMRIDAITGTQRAASAALNALAGSGKVASRNLEEFATTALRMEDIVGASVADTAKQFEELGKAPFEASKKLDQQYRYLSASTLDYIRTLEDQGKAELAAATAQQSFSDAMKQRTDKLEGDLGSIERAWKAVKKEAADAIDVMLGIGRVKPVEVQLTGAQSNLEALQKKFDDRVSRGMATGDLKPKLDAARDLVNTLTEVNKLDKQGAAAVADRLRADEAAKRINDILYAGRGDAKKLEEDIAKIRADGLISGKSELDILNAINIKKAEYAKKNPVKNDSSEVANIIARTQASRSYLEQLKLIGIEADSLNEGEKLALQYQEQLKGKLDAKTEAQVKAALAASQSYGAVLKEIDATKELAKAQDEFQKARDKENEQIADSIGKINAKAQAVEDEIAMYGLGKEAIDSIAISRLEEKKAGLLQFAGSEERIRQIEEEIEARKRLSKALDTKDFLDESAKAAKKLTEEWKRDFDRIEDWIGDAIGRGITKGKDLWKSLIDGLKASFARLVLSPVITPIAAMGASFLNPAAAQAAGSAGSALGSASSIFSAGKMLWDGFNGGFGTSFASSIGNGINTLGAKVGSEMMMDFGNGMMNNGFGSGAAGSAGQTAGQFAGYAGNALAGYGLQKGISNGFEIGNGNVMDAITLVASAYFGPIAGVVAGAVNRAFGRKTVGSGVMGSIQGDDFSGQSYQFQKGGWFRGDKTKTSALDSETDAAFSAAIAASYSSFADLGKAVGAGGDLLKDFSYQFRLALADFDEAGKQAEIQRALSSMTDSMATAFVDNFRTSVDTAAQAASRYWTNTIDGEAGRPNGPSNIVSQAAVSSPLDPYIGDMVRIFDTFKASIAGVDGSEGKLAAFTQGLFGLGDALAENGGFLKTFGESLDFDKLEAAGKKGETVMDTFARLNTVFGVTNDLAMVLGREMTSAFGAVGTASTEARERLINLAGGVESLASQTAFYAQNFLSPDQQAELARKQLKNVLEPAGLGDIDTGEEYTAKVNELFGKTDEASQKMLATLLKLGPAMLSVANAAKAIADARMNLDIEFMDLLGNGYEAIKARRAQALKDADPSLRPQMQRNFDREDMNTTLGKTIELMRLTGNAAGALALERERELALLPESARALQRMIYARQDEITAAENAFSGLQRAVDAERTHISKVYQDLMDSLADRIGKVGESVSKLTGLSNTLKSTINSMRVESQLNIDKASARADIQTALAIAKAGGVFPDSADLQNSLALLARPDEQLYASFVDFQYAYLKDKNAIADLAGLTDVQLSVEEKMLEELKDQQKSAGQMYEAEMGRLDTIITNAQAQLNALNGINTSVLTIPQAMAQFASAIQSASRPAPAASGGGSSGGGAAAPAGSAQSFVEGLYGSLLGRASDASGLAAHIAAIQAGASFQQITENFLNSDEYKNIRGFASGGYHTGGLRIVGENGPELEATGPSRIFNASQTAEILRGSGGSNTARLEALVERLTQEVVQLRRDNSAENVAIVRETHGAHYALDSVVQGRIPLQVVIEDNETPIHNRYVTVRETA